MLERDATDIEIVARLLRQLADHDGFTGHLPGLSQEEVRIIGARYNCGSGLTLEHIKRNLSYGNLIVKFWPRFVGLLR